MAKTVTINIPHDLGVVEARRRLDDGLTQLGAQVPGGLVHLKQSWDGNLLSFAAQVMGQRITGRLEVLDKAVRVDLDLPAFLAMMAGRIKGAVQKEGQLLLEKK
jgi:hypothetical protein